MKLKNLVFVAIIGLLVASCNSGISQNVDIQSDSDSACYLLGYENGKGLFDNKDQFPGDINLEAIAAGYAAGIMGDESKLSVEDAKVFLNAYFMAAQQKEGEGVLAEGEAFLAENAKRPGVTSLMDGKLQYEVLKEGTGAKPTVDQTVEVHYHGTLIDGTVFDSSVDRGTPAEFSPKGVIKGWTEILPMMPVGSKWKVFIHPDLAYGNRGTGAIKPNSTLIFEIELISIK